MCTSKVYVPNALNGRGNWYNCGKCPSCLQNKADTRASRIKSHKPNGFQAYFVTLTYDNKYLPYIKKSEFVSLNKIFRQWLNSQDDSKPIKKYMLSVYRDTPTPRFYRGKLCNPPQDYEPNIGQLPIKLHYDDKLFNTLQGITLKYYKKTDTRICDPDKISICYPADKTNFVKRLRTNMARFYGVRKVPITYYYAPEYGPTSQRYHIHLLLWIPRTIKGKTKHGHHHTYKIGLKEVNTFISQAWPFMDKKLFSLKRRHPAVQIAVCPADYLASYVNSGTNVSPLIQHFAKLRTSHSLSFGFDKNVYDLSRLLDLHKTRRYTYNVRFATKNNGLVEMDVLIPKFVIYRYFPRIKGYSRLTRNQVFKYMYDAPKYFTILDKCPDFHHNENSENYYLPYLEHGCKYYPTLMLDTNYQPIYYTEKECKYTLNRIYNTFYKYWQPLGYSYYDYCTIVSEYLDGYSQALYRESQSDIYSKSNVLRFYNLDDVKLRKIQSPTISPFITDLSLKDLHCNNLPEERYNSLKSEERYYKREKQHKVNNYRKT